MPDTNIPILKKADGAVWSPIHTVNGQEERLTRLLAEQQVRTYYPVTISRDGNTGRIPFFQDVAFAAPPGEQRVIIEHELLVSKVMEIHGRDTEEFAFADMIFMNPAE